MGFDADYYKLKFKCGNKGCNGSLVPIQLRENKNKNYIEVIGRCPKCHKKYRFSLPLDEKEVKQWSDDLRREFLTCSECGEVNSLKTIKVKGNPKSDYKVKVECSECGHEESRFIDGDLFFLLEKDLPPEERIIIICQTCGTKLRNEEKKCPKCGREIYCSKCGALIPPQAKFCVKCGDPVDLGDFSKKEVLISKDIAGVCPTCGNVLTKEHNFCNVCGQEIRCNNCGALLSAGAVYCNECGDIVRKGKI
ncbi:MAG: zinc-ribbon domain-containing protein [Promethearchaeota archaeon]